VPGHYLLLAEVAEKPWTIRVASCRAEVKQDLPGGGRSVLIRRASDMVPAESHNRACTKVNTKAVATSKVP